MWGCGGALEVVIGWSWKKRWCGKCRGHRGFEKAMVFVGTDGNGGEVAGLFGWCQ